MGELKLVRVNRVQLSGRVTRDFVLRYTTDGTAIAVFTVAFNRWVREEDGGWREVPGFVGALASGRLAERCAEHLHKGSPVYMEGRLQSRRYRTRDGKTRNVVEVRLDHAQFLEREPSPEDEPHEWTPPPPRVRKRRVVEGELFPEAKGTKRED